MGQNLIEKVLNFLYPPVCGLCGSLNDEYICNTCINHLNKYKRNKLDVYSNKFFENHFWIYKYEDIVRHLIIDYKFNEKSYIYMTIAELILMNKKAREFISAHDVIIPVPIHKNRKKKRGYNQCELIAKGICKNITNLQLEYRILKKVKNTSPQSTLNKIQRSINVQGGYEINYKYLEQTNLKNKKIIIFDDIYTTGNTVNECAKVLKEVTDAQIDVITFARD